MRNLVSIRTIDNIIPIPNADAIECVHIGGWPVVAKKGEFAKGDKCLYFEVDSFLPESDERFSFLKSPIEFNGKRGFRLKTIKLRGQVSQGLALPLSIFPEIHEDANNIAETLGVEKWEHELPLSVSGDIKGVFPYFIPKTDQERIENIADVVFQNVQDRYEVTLKLDGSSMTVYKHNGQYGVCMRNYELKITPDSSSAIVKMFYDADMENLFRDLDNIAIQGEIMGPGIQKNRENFPHKKFFIFDMYNISEQRYYTPSERHNTWINISLNMDKDIKKYIDHVPIIHQQVPLSVIATNINDIITYSDRKSINNKIAEGLVYKREDAKFSFKSISRNYLLKCD